MAAVEPPSRRHQGCAPRSRRPFGARLPATLNALQVRRLALALPGTEEGVDRGRSSFRVRGITFATLPPGGQRAILRLARDERDALRQIQPATFGTLRNGQGWLCVELHRVDPWMFEELLVGAWRRVASRRAIARWNADRYP